MTAGPPSDVRVDPAHLLTLAQGIGIAAREMDTVRIARLGRELRDHARALEHGGARGGDDLNAVVAALTALRAITADIEAERRHLTGRRARDRRVRLAYDGGG